MWLPWQWQYLFGPWVWLINTFLVCHGHRCFFFLSVFVFIIFLFFIFYCSSASLGCKQAGLITFRLDMIPLRQAEARETQQIYRYGFLGKSNLPSYACFKSPIICLFHRGHQRSSVLKCHRSLQLKQSTEILTYGPGGNGPGNEDICVVHGRYFGSLHKHGSRITKTYGLFSVATKLVDVDVPPEMLDTWNVFIPKKVWVTKNWTWIWLHASTESERVVKGLLSLEVPSVNAGWMGCEISICGKSQKSWISSESGKIL